MEYSKDIMFNTKSTEVKKINNKLYKKRTSHGNAYKIFAMISVICMLLIGVDMILIFNFASILQKSAILI